MKPENQNVAPRAPRTPAEDIEISLKVGEEIRKVADLYDVPERRVRAAVVAWAQPIVEKEIVGHVGKIFRKDLDKRSPVEVPAGSVNRGPLGDVSGAQ